MSGMGRFAFPGAAIDVAADEPALSWLAHFLRPWFSAGDGGATHRAVSLVADASRHAAISSMARGRTDSVPCFLLDTRIISHPLIGSADGRSWIDDRELDVVYGVDDSSVEIVTAADGPQSRVALMRVVRELALVQARRQGWVVQHCSAVAHEDRAVSFCGPKKAGKTSMLLHSLAAGSAAFVANDRAVVTTAEDQTVVLRGMPTIVALRADTLGLFPAFAERIRPAPDRHWLTPAESQRRVDRPWLDPGRPVDLSPNSLATLLGVEVRAEAPLGMIAFPHVDPSIAGYEVRPLTPAEALLRLRGGLLGAATPDAPLSVLDSIGGFLSRSAVEAHEASLERLSRLPAAVLRIGSNAFDGEWPGQRLLNLAA
jgi:hypothetical protein